MVEVSVEVDPASLARLDDLLERISKECPQRLVAELRRAGIYLCKSFKTRTKKAPKKIPKNEYRAAVSTLPPKYIHSNSAHHRLLRRWSLTRKIGTPAESTYHYYVYTDRHRAKGGRMQGGSLAAERRELLKLHGAIPRAGLAQKSWGWVAQGIYNNAAGMGDLSWKRRRRERRDPRDYVRGLFLRFGADASVTLMNKLDYILAALPPSAINEGIAAAMNKLDYNMAAYLAQIENAPSSAARRSYGPRKSYEQVHGREDYRSFKKDTFPF